MVAFLRRNRAQGVQNSNHNSPVAHSWEFGDGGAERRASAANRTIEGELLPPKRSPSDAPAARGRPPRTSSASQSLTAAFDPKLAPARGVALCEALDAALDDWWLENKLPPLGLLRDGLLALEAGQRLNEGHDSLLLRTALAYRRGILTALHHQQDPERTAFILKEALLHLQAPLTPAMLWQLKRDDEPSAVWVPLLIRELLDEMTAVNGVQQELAARAVRLLEGNQPPKEETNEVAALRTWQTLRPILQPRLPKASAAYWSPGRLLVLTVLVLGVTLGTLVTRGRGATPAVERIPAGVYTVGSVLDAANQRTVQVSALLMDRTEVTNGAYQQCVLAGACPAPTSAASVTRNDYYTNPLYAAFPVVNVDWPRANAYCTWVGRRLPTADEWEVAAGAALATGRHYRYPWGERFDPQLANTRARGIGDLQAVGSYHPAGNSPSALADMAGNAAEWTATAAVDGSGRYVVKGGSFQDDRGQVTTSAQQSFEQTYSAPWLGFRCVKSNA
jgi:formylglycine-generating enzyme required for sulfatase activity